MVGLARTDVMACTGHQDLELRYRPITGEEICIKGPDRETGDEGKSRGTYSTSMFLVVFILLLGITLRISNSDCR